MKFADFVSREAVARISRQTTKNRSFARWLRHCSLREKLRHPSSKES